MEEVEECESSIREYVDADEVSHDCIEPKGHDGPHSCCVCSEQW